MTKMAIPTKPEELEELLSDTGKVANLVKEGQFGDLLNAYRDAFNKKDKEFRDNLKNEVQLGIQAFLKDNKDKNRAVPLDFGGSGLSKAELTRGGKGERYNKRAPGAKVDSDVQFVDAAEFFQATWHNSASLPSGRELAEKRDQVRAIQNSYGSVIPADGGFLIPETLRSELLSVSLATATVRPRATVIPMSSLRVPIPMVDETTHVGSIAGGIVAYWTEEGAPLTESQGAFGRVVLDAKKLTAFAIVPNELIQDAPAFMGYFDQGFPRAISFFEDKAFMGGSGVGEPLGWLSNQATVTTAAKAGQGANTIVWQNVVEMYARMLPSSLNSAVWVVSPDVFPQLATMALSVGTGGSAIWLTDGTGTPQLSLLGRPVVISEFAPTLGTTGDISFVDLSYYLIGDRQAMQSASSADYKFGNDQTAFRIIERVDGQPWIKSAITPANGGNPLSPFVQLSSTRT